MIRRPPRSTAVPSTALLRSLAIVEKLAARDEGNAGWQRDLSVSWNKIGDTRVAQGDLAGALRAYSDKIATVQDRTPRTKCTPISQRDLSVSWSKIGDTTAAQ